MDNQNLLITKIQEKIEKFILPTASKLSSQRHLASIRDGLTYLVPFTIIGGLSILISSPPVSANLQGTNFFYQFMLAWKDWASQYSSILMIPYNLTIGIISIYVVAGITYKLATHYKMNAIANTLVTTFIFTCISAAPEAYKVGEATVSAIPTAQLGASSMFAAIIVAIAGVEINHFLIEHNIKISMPKSVPPNVSGPFEVLIPLIVSTFIFFGINLLCTSMTGAGLTQLVFKIFQPLLSATGSLPSILFITLLTQIFWFFGIHGNNMVSAVVTPVTTANIALNLEAYNAGKPMTAIFAGSFNSIYGGWLTYTAILITLIIFCKSPQLKSISKVAPISTAFNVNEPLIFGIPTVLNVYTFFGITLSSLLNVTIAYISMSTGIVGKMYLTVPWTTPAPLAAFLSTMDFKAVILWAILLVLDIAIILPFMKMYDKQLIKETVEG